LGGRLNIGIIGCGKQGLKHIRALKAFSDMEIFVADENYTLAKDVAQAEGVKVSKNVPLCDAIVVCTPLNNHYRLIETALTRGMNVFCEKPLCNDIEEAKTLERLMLSTDRFIQVGYVYRYAPIFAEIYKILNESQVLGKPLLAFFRLGGRGSHQEWKHKKDSGGGAINEMLVHMLDLAIWFFGPMHHVGYEFHQTYLDKRRIDEQLIDCDVEDFVFLKYTTLKGVDVHIQADMLTPAFSQYVEIQSENGSFFGSIQPDVPSYLFLKEARGGYEAGKTTFNFGKRDFFAAQMTDFIYSVAVNKWPVKNTVNDSILLMQCLKEAGLNR
jgi:predicted dehydrogenase